MNKIERCNQRHIIKLTKEQFALIYSNPIGEIIVALCMSDIMIVFASNANDLDISTKTNIDGNKVTTECVDKFSGSAAAECVWKMGYREGQHSAILNVATSLI